jgi:hypothetical protein
MGGMQKPPWENKPSFRLVDSGQILFDRLRHAEVRPPALVLVVAASSVWSLSYVVMLICARVPLPQYNSSRISPAC